MNQMNDDSVSRFATVTRRRALPDEIAQVIERRIATGELARGQRLPTEAELSEQFGVSRNVLREAMARLKRDGLIETRQGLGAFVSQTPANLTWRIGTADFSGENELRYIFELRAEVETGAAALAAERRTEEQLTQIRRSLKEMGAAITAGADGVDADATFHRAIAEASNNPYYRDFMIFLAISVTQSIAVARKNSAQVEQWTPTAQREHECICEAIAARDPEAARHAVRSHLTSAARRLGLIEKPETQP